MIYLILKLNNNIKRVNNFKEILLNNCQILEIINRNNKVFIYNYCINSLGEVLNLGFINSFLIGYLTSSSDKLNNILVISFKGEAKDNLMNNLLFTK